MENVFPNTWNRVILYNAEKHRFQQIHFLKKGYDMRVIAGTRRRLQLKTIDSMDTRPTTDRIKETLFNMIQFDIPGIDFLDLFAGSGGIGIEALSRGARRAVFVDSNPKACACIRDNLEHTRLTDASEVIQSDFMSALSRLKNRDYHFGIVFMDPPYNSGMERKALRLIHDLDCVDTETLFIIEADINDDMSDLPELGYTITREKLYKTNKHVFLRKK